MAVTFQKKIMFIEAVGAATDAAIAANEQDRMLILGKMYHQLAEEIFEETGIDPRPYDEVYWPSRNWFGVKEEV